jgi:RNA polymerase sigma factor (sigma-70 family)
MDSGIFILRPPTRVSTQTPMLAPELSATELTRAISNGDCSAMEVFYRRYFHILYSNARRATRRDEAFCLDVVHDAVLRILRSVREVESEAQLLAWLRLVVRATAYDLLKAQQRRAKREAATATKAAKNSLTALAEAEQLKILHAQIALLDPQLAHLIDLRYRQQWTLTRIAGSLGLTIGTIDGRLRKALKTLRDNMTEGEERP